MALTPVCRCCWRLRWRFTAFGTPRPAGDTRPAAKHLYTATGFAVLTLVLSLHAFPWDFVEGWFRPRRRQGRGMFQFRSVFSLRIAAALRCCAVCAAAAAGAPRRVGRRGALSRAALLTASITETNIMSAQGESPTRPTTRTPPSTVGRRNTSSTVPAPMSHLRSLSSPAATCTLSAMKA